MGEKSMFKCHVSDETCKAGYESKGQWLEEFGRVPAIGEIIIRGDYGLVVTSVIWGYREFPFLTVEWQGWSR
jgi:hypothetical protein